MSGNILINFIAENLEDWTALDRWKSGEKKIEKKIVKEIRLKKLRRKYWKSGLKKYFIYSCCEKDWKIWEKKKDWKIWKENYWKSGLKK